MVGPGTGIAPFRSFWQNRLFHKRQINGNADNEEEGPGSMELYFGCRNSSVDFIYKEELLSMQRQEVLDDVKVAFSREPEKGKVTVL